MNKNINETNEKLDNTKLIEDINISAGVQEKTTDNFDGTDETALPTKNVIQKSPSLTIARFPPFPDVQNQQPSSNNNQFNQDTKQTNIKEENNWETCCELLACCVNFWECFIICCECLTLSLNTTLTKVHVKTKGQTLMILDIDEIVREEDIRQVLKRKINNENNFVDASQVKLAEKPNKNGYIYAFVTMQPDAASYITRKKKIGEGWNRWRIRELDPVERCRKCHRIEHRGASVNIRKMTKITATSVEGANTKKMH
ncbi:unnamed protein product [Psylliodes chrysocephalus]|uniref:Uncharacterized protein n=1 Tax=Psylliodes chrysocephalus TaxID=3402493 RepID=A0A9P0G7K3_9CUCU|nr:unnamed protein product [Psylliodes chrysocephala]